MNQYLSEAFKSLDILNEEVFSVDENGLKDLVTFEENDEDTNIIDIIDTEAETIDDLEDSYEGKIILDCTICHSKQYRNVEDVIIEGDLANVGEECPFCYTNDGFKIIGQVAPFKNEEEIDEPKSEEETPVDESLNEATATLSRVKGTLGNVLTAHADELAQVYDAKSALAFLDSIEPEVDQKDYLKRVRLDIIKRPQGAVNYLYNIILKGDGMGREVEEDLLVRGEDGKLTTTSQDGRWGNSKEWDYNNEELEEHNKESLEESVNNVNVETDEDVINVATDDNGKVTVTTEPKVAAVESEEVITPIEPEVQNELKDNVGSGEEIEIDIDEFDEESFDDLGESYLKNIYDNIDSYKTSKVTLDENVLKVDGSIKFKSGNTKKTSFLFEARTATKTGKVKFIGENAQITKGKKAFTITGKIEGKKFLSESLNYNYGAKTPEGKTKRLYGTIKK